MNASWFIMEINAKNDVGYWFQRAMLREYSCTLMLKKKSSVLGKSCGLYLWQIISIQWVNHMIFIFHLEWSDNFSFWLKI